MSDIEAVQPETPENEPVENTEVAEHKAETEAEEAKEEESAASEDADEEHEKPKRRSRAEERINALTREKYEAQKAYERAQAQIAEMTEHFQRLQQPPQQAEMPRLSDYDYDEGRYQQAIAAWNQSQRQQWEQQQAQQRKQAEQQQEYMRQQQAVQQKFAEGTNKYPDFVAKVMDPTLPPLRDINQAAYQAVIESDAAVDVAYYLANNPQEVYEFASMNPVQAIRKVAQLEVKLTAKPTAARPVTKPPSRVNGASDSAKDPEKMTTAEWLEWRNAQLKANQR